MSVEDAAVPGPAIQSVAVDTGRERYNILIGRGLLAQAQCWTGLPRSTQAVVVSNATGSVTSSTAVLTVAPAITVTTANDEF